MSSSLRAHYSTIPYHGFPYHRFSFVGVMFPQVGMSDLLILVVGGGYLFIIDVNIFLVENIFRSSG